MQLCASTRFIYYQDLLLKFRMPAFDLFNAMFYTGKHKQSKWNAVEKLWCIYCYLLLLLDIRIWQKGNIPQMTH